MSQPLRKNLEEGLEQLETAQITSDAAWEDMHAAGWDSISIAFQNAMGGTDYGMISTKEAPMIEALKDFPENVTAFVCRGHVTRNDYDTVLVPAVEKALKTHKKVRLYYETADDFAGIDSGAVWEDFKVGMEHITRWERIAVVTDVDWIRHTMRTFSFLMPGELRVFSSAQASEARAWIGSN